MEVLDEAMCRDPKYYQKHYHGTPEEIALKRKYSFSDRCRYYLPVPEVEEAMNKLFANFENGVPLNLLSQFMPIQYTKVREGSLENRPEMLVMDRVANTIDEYLFVLKKEHPSNFNEFYLFSEKNSIENAALLKYLQKYTSILTSYLSNAPEGLEK